MICTLVKRGRSPRRIPPRLNWDLISSRPSPAIYPNSKEGPEREQYIVDIKEPKLRTLFLKARIAQLSIATMTGGCKQTPWALRTCKCDAQSIDTVTLCSFAHFTGTQSIRL